MNQICPKTVFSVKNGKSEHSHWILHIRIILGIKWFGILKPNFSEKGISDKKQKKLDFYVRSWLLLAVLLTIITLLERTGPTVFLMYLLLVAQTTRSLRYQYSTISVLHVIIWLSYNIPLLLLLLLPLNNSTTTEQCQYSVMFSLLPRDNYTTT